jgi:hypothetical protein
MDENAQPSLTRQWPDPSTGPLTLRVWFGTVNDRPAVVKVEISGDGDAAVHAADCRLPLGAMLDAHVTMALSRVRASRALYGEHPGLQKFEGREGLVGRPRMTDAFLKQVAEVYTAAVGAGDRKPAHAVQSQLGPDATVATARSWIRKARVRGFLPPVKKDSRP